MNKSTTIYTRFFRGGVGTVIYNQAGEVALFERAKHPIGVWQFQQGGIDNGEDIKTTLWRELKEEIGLTKDDIRVVHEMPSWTVHQEENSVSDPNKSRLGQAHRWFFLELKETSTINLSKAGDDETADFKWTTFSEAIDVTEDLKKHVYRELEQFFIKNVIT